MSNTAPRAKSNDVADALAARLSAHTVNDETFWNFEDVKKRSGGHALFQYPAMMVPELQRVLLQDLAACDPNLGKVYDPFMGSGTIMLECMRLGLDFHGSDINPMAVLLTYVKAHPPAKGRSSLLVDLVVDDARAVNDAVPHAFTYREKWFTANVASGLDRIRHAIVGIPDVDERRFLWVCLAETIRLISNSRTSTVKLHSYSEEQIVVRDKIDPIHAFKTVATRNAANVEEHWRQFDVTSKSTIILLRGDVTGPWGAPLMVDAVMTSPPYGDNQSTVTYGQHSYLPLQWIPSKDLVGSFDAELLASTHRLDTLSLGGSIRSVRKIEQDLVTASPSLARFMLLISGKSDLEKKVLAFFRDYQVSLTAVSDRLRDDGFSFWTLGQRRVGGHEVPLVRITKELLERVGHREVLSIERNLPLKRKRMGTRNRQSALMATETILVMQKRATAALPTN